MDGRLRFADHLPYDTRHPILLPKGHAVTRLVIVDAHERLGHGTGVEHVLTELRSRFWIVKGRRMVRSVTEACTECRRRFSTKTGNQIMAPLPKSRLQSSLRAFENVGADYGGPFLTKQGRGKTRAKCYLCLFTFLTTRAVHLETSYSLDTDSFINAFTRMTSRRGTPTYVISDNGTNFVGAERELRELVESLDSDRIVQETTTYRPIDWKFNPPSAPHFGGVFEAMIKSAKKAIKAILGDADVTDEELHSAICGGTIVTFPAINLCEPNAHRGEWPLGRVIEAYPGADGLVRVVKVKAKDKEYLRPVHRLCPLEYVPESAEE